MTTAETAVSGGSSSPSREIRDELASDAQRLKDTAKTRAAEEAESKKADTARAGHSISAALGKAAGELEGDDRTPGWVTTAFRKTASSVDRLSSDLEGRSAEDMARQVRTFARENPTAFLAASAAAGFAAARLLRAGSHHEDEQRDDDPARHSRSPQGESAFDLGRRDATSPQQSDPSTYPIGGTRP